MALTKSNTLPNAVTVGYHHVDSIFYKRSEGLAEIVFASYTSEADMRAGAKPVTVTPLLVKDEEAEMFLAALHDVAAPLAYAAAKQTPDFSDAKDA